MPDEARALVVRTMRKAEGNVSQAARMLGICRRQLQRYLVRFDLWDKVDQVRASTGWHRPQLREGKKRTRWLRARRKQSTRVETGNRPPV